MALLCAFRWILRKKSEDEGAEEEQPASANFLYILTAGVMWCTAFYSSLMGWRMQGAPEYSALNIPVICMALAGIFWGVQLSEWSNTNRRALWALYSGIVLTVLAWIVVGGAQYLSRLGM